MQIQELQVIRSNCSKQTKRKTGNNIIALVRSSQKTADLGVETREADYNKPETLKAALKEAETLLLISGNKTGRRVTQH